MNQDLTFNIALTTAEVEDIMQTLVDKATNLNKLQNKIYDQAMQQKKQFEEYQQSIIDGAIQVDEAEESAQYVNETEEPTTEEDVVEINDSEVAD